MRTTRRSLLLRVRDPADHEAWDQFYELYAPILFRFARAQGLSADDAEEIRDQCLELLARKMPSFDYDPASGRFKGWLFRVAHGRVVDWMRRRAARPAEDRDLAEMVDPSPSPEQAWSGAWRVAHLRYCLDRACSLAPERNARAFTMLLDDGRSVPEVCAELHMNANQVYKAKSQILRDVRRILRELGE